MTLIPFVTFPVPNIPTVDWLVPKFPDSELFRYYHWLTYSLIPIDLIPWLIYSCWLLYSIRWKTTFPILDWPLFSDSIRCVPFGGRNCDYWRLTTWRCVLVILVVLTVTLLRILTILLTFYYILVMTVWYTTWRWRIPVFGDDRPALIPSIPASIRPVWYLDDYWPMTILRRWPTITAGLPAAVGFDWLTVTVFYRLLPYSQSYRLRMTPIYYPYRYSAGKAVIVCYCCCYSSIRYDCIQFILTPLTGDCGR